MNRAAALLIALPALTGQDAVKWRDPSPHQVRSVTVDSSVRLEVLDWGGTGRPILFVGCYLTAHVYDEIAPKLTDQFHVYAVTRRGVGASDRPSTGYDPLRRTADIVEVIGALDMKKPILVGNSCGGGILHSVGADHPDRAGGLVYLDAAEDPTLKQSDYEQVPVDLVNLPKRVERPERSVVFPEAEDRQLAERPIDPAIRKAIVEDNNVKPPYARIRVPVLAIYRITTMEQALKEYPPQNEKERGALNQGYARHQLHDERARGGVIRRCDFFNPENLGNMGMVQRRQRLCFARKAHHAVGIVREGVGDDLDRDLAIEPRVTRAIHLAHAAGTELADDFVVREFATRAQHSSGSLCMS